ncbi:MAG: hypothetical protein AAF677_05405, partial [Pseudomonadota bacterium]
RSAGRGRRGAVGGARAAGRGRRARLTGRSGIVCEGNCAPPNPGPDAFYARPGFVEMGRGRAQPGMLVRDLSPDLEGP